MNWAAAEEKFGIQIKRTKQLGGGDISTVWLLEIKTQNLILKVNSAEQKAMSEAEFKGLKILRDAGVIQVPMVFEFGLLNDRSFILMEFIPAGKAHGQTFTEFGEKLAALHQFDSATFGLDHDNFIGALPQRNFQHEKWNMFFWYDRIQPQFKLALWQGLMHESEIPEESNFLQLVDEVFCNHKPALLHGDLWNGNKLVTLKGNVALIDPAVYYGHPMMDLGMTLLFGGFPEKFYEAYYSNAGISGNIQQQTDLAQLYYLLVHLNLFGSSYYASVKSLLKKYFD